LRPSPLPLAQRRRGLNGQGLQYAGSIRLRPFRWRERSRFAPFVGGGISAGAYEQIDYLAFVGGDPPQGEYRWNFAWWGNLETGTDMRIGGRFTVRPSVGFAFLGNPGDGQVLESPPPGVQHTLLYFSVAFGLGFGL
jgi:hypothetical protein